MLATTTKFSSIAVILISIGVVQCQNPPPQCQEHRTFQNELWRSAAVESNGTTRNCDSALRPGWYKILPIGGTDGRADLIWKTPEVGLFKCGTRFPIYLNAAQDPLPKTLHDTVTVGLCIYIADGFLSCAAAGNVDITNCGDYNVYKLGLPSSTLCPSAYCTSNKAPCPPGTFSLDGFQPGCTDQVPIYTGKPVVEYQVDHGNSELLFFCSDNNTQVSDKNLEHFRRVRWFMTRADDVTGRPTLVHESKALKFQANHLLTEDDWRDQFSLGVNITCEIKGFTPNDIPGNTATSNSFYAGLQATPDLVVIQGNSKGSVKISSTVPILCPKKYIVGNTCTKSLRVSVITRDHASTTCSNGDFNPNIIIPTTCGTEFVPVLPSQLPKDQSTTLSIQGRQPDVFNGNAASSLTLTVNEQDGFEIWKQKIPDISVKVVNENAITASKVCSSINDPHMTTFEGRSYELQEAGTFILYKHETLPIQVQAAYQRCSPNSRAYCNCGLAVQSGQDVFVYDLCKKESTEFNRVVQFLRVGVLGCDNKAMVIEKKSDGSYNIVLPTGTKIYVSRPYQTGNKESFVGSIRLTASTSDFGFNTIGGACGVIVPQNDQDLKPKGGNAAIQDSKTFYKTWQVTDVKENLFLSPYLVDDDSFTLPSQCECQADPNNDLTTEAFCDAAVAGTRCDVKDDETLLRVCNLQGKRRKREEMLAQADSDIFAEKFTFPVEDDTNLPPPAFNNQWTEQKATEFCRNFLNDNAPAECLELENLDVDALIEGCVLDIKAVRNTDFALGNLQVLLRDCVIEVVGNNTVIVEVDPSDPNPPQITTTMKPNSTKVEQLLKKICPGACSLQGRCVESVCQCDEGFAGPDCSVDLNVAPSNLLLLNNGVCDLQMRSCLSTIVFGQDISTVNNVTCVIKEYIYQEFTKVKVAEYNVSANVMSSGQVKCTLRRSDPDQTIYAYEIALNNGGDNSEFEEMVVFDSNCIEVTEEKQPQLKRGVCVIDSVCHAEGDVNPANEEETCEPEKNPLAWTSPEPEITHYRQCFDMFDTILDIFTCIQRLVGTPRSLFLGWVSRNN